MKNEQQQSDAIYCFADELTQQDLEAPALPERRRKLETWLSFRLEAETFGLPVTHVQEVVKVGSISRVPEAPAAIRQSA